MKLWISENPFPTFESLSYAPGVQYLTPHTMKEDGYHFLLGAAVVKHGGALRVSFANSLRTENDDCTRLVEAVSFDEGKTWREHVIAETQNGYGRSHGVYFPYKDDLYVFCPRAKYDKIDRYPDLKMEAYRLNGDGEYDCLGIALEGDFWPMCEPLALDDGGFVMAGLKTDSGTAAVALCDGADVTKWEMVQPPNPNGFHYWGETTVLKQKDRLLAIVRNSGAIRNLLVSESLDRGKTWSALEKSDFPASYSKNCAGVTAKGIAYLIFNMRDRGAPIGRDTLAIAVGRGGFEKVYLLRDGFDHPPFHWQYNEWSYPYVCEDPENGKIYIAYSKNKEDCEVAVVSVEELC